MYPLLFLSTALFLQVGPGREENPEGASGILIVVGIALLVLLIAAGALYLVSRRARSKPRPDADELPPERPLPSEEGRQWSSER